MRRSRVSNTIAAALLLAGLVNAKPPAGTLNIPLTVNKEQRYVVGVNMKFNFVMALNTGFSAVAGDTCTNCNGVPSYNSSLSSSEHALTTAGSVNFGQASVSGPLIKEDCGLQQNNGSAWLYPNQTIMIANSSSSLFSDVTSGLFGLGTNANGANGDFFDTVFGGFLARNTDQNNFTFGMDLKPPKFTSEEDTGSGGVLHWLVPDAKAYDANNVTWTTASVSSAQANAGASTNSTESTGNTGSNSSPNAQFILPESDWTIDLGGWAVSVSGSFVSNTTTSQAIVEPFFPNIYFPDTQANLLYAVVPSSTRLSNLVSGAQTWSVPCDTQISLAFTFNGQAFPIDQSLLVQQQSDGSCIGTVQAWPDPTVNNFLLGSNFISAYYLIYVIGLPGSGVSNSIGWTSKTASTSSKTNVGAIVGGTVGGVACIAIVALGAFVCWRRNRRKRSTGASTVTATSSGYHPSSPPPSGTREKFDYSRDSPYIFNALPHSSQFTTPPPSAGRSGSANAFLPEAHTPQEPSFAAVPSMNSRSGSHPPSPNSASNFLALSPSTGPGSPHRQEGSNFSMNSRIAYNANALGANRPNSAHSSGSPSTSPPVSLSQFSVPVPGLGQFNSMTTIEPFIMPTTSSSSQPTSSASEKFRNLNALSGSDPNAQTHHQPEPSSPRDIDPLGSSTVSTRATAVPLVLPPPSGDDIKGSRDGKASRGRVAAPMRVVDPPAPPYSAQATAPVSPTLVDSGDDHGHSP